MNLIFLLIIIIIIRRIEEELTNYKYIYNIYILLNLGKST